MNHIFDPKEQQRLAEARESFSARLLTDSQFDDAIAITGILEREIKRTGTFKDKLSDYAVAFARTDKFDVLTSEMIIRDLYTARTGQSMNALREALVKKQDNLSDKELRRPYAHAKEVGSMIEQGTLMSFKRAYNYQGASCAQELGITENAAKKLMNETFENNENRPFYDWGKKIEEAYYRPQVEKLKAQSQANKQRKQSRKPQLQQA